MVSPINHTDRVIEDKRVFIYFKVDTYKYLTSKPVLTFNGSTEMTRWLVSYYAASDDGGIGDEIENVSNVLHFYVGLETKTTFSYKYDNGRYVIEVESDCGSAKSHADIKGLCYIPKFNCEFVMIV